MTVWNHRAPQAIDLAPTTSCEFDQVTYKAVHSHQSTTVKIQSEDDPQLSRIIARVHPGAPWIAHWFAQRTIAVWLTIGLALIGVWLHGAANGFIPCEQDCGETFDALQYVSNYRLYGFRYGLVQDHATSRQFEARPYFYTHNVNLSGILFTLLDAVGATPFWSKQLVTLAVFGVGLWYVYRATAYHSRSRLAGFCVLILFVTDVQHVLAFGLSPLRAWHWLAIFGLVFHAGRLARQPTTHPTADWVGIVVCALIAFGVGYDFWVICIAVTLIVVGLYRPRDLLRLRGWSVFVGLGLAFTLPFIVRQIQMAAVLGLDFWMLDIVYSAAIKIPMLGRLISVPSVDELDAVYRAAGILRAPSAPTDSVHSILLLLTSLVTLQLIPSIGLITFVLTITVSILAVVAAVRLIRLRPRVLLAGLHEWGIRRRVRQHLVGTVVLIAALVAGVAVGLGFFAPHSLIFFLKHEFPLVAAPILVIKGSVLAALIRAVISCRSTRRFAAGLISVVIIIDHLIVQVDNVWAFQPMDVSWVPAVEARRDSTFAVSWIPNSVSVFTDTWVVGITPGLERELSSRISSGQPPFALSDYFLFGERDAASRPDLYTRPDFWLYYPTDRRMPFDQPSPSCRTDYVTALIQWVGVGRLRQDVEVSPLMVSAPRVRPGAVLTVGSRVTNNRGRRFQVDLLHDGVPIAPATFNCRIGVFVGEYQIPTTTPPGSLSFGARLVGPDGQIIQVAEVQIEIALDAPPVKRYVWAQPTPDELIALNPTLPVVDRGADYVIFDLRGLYRER